MSATPINGKEYRHIQGPENGQRSYISYADIVKRGVAGLHHTSETSSETAKNSSEGIKTKKTCDVERKSLGTKAADYQNSRHVVEQKASKSRRSGRGSDSGRGSCQGSERSKCGADLLGGHKVQKNIEYKSVGCGRGIKKSKAAAVIAEQLKELMELKEARIKWQKAQVQTLLAHHPKKPLDALWVVLNDKSLLGPELPTAIVDSPCCGITLQCDTESDAGSDTESDAGSDEESDRCTKGKGGATPLILAVRAKRPEVVSALLNHPTVKISMNVVDTLDKNGISALHHAAASNDVASMQLLVSKGAYLNNTEICYGGGVHTRAPYTWQLKRGTLPV